MFKHRFKPRIRDQSGMALPIAIVSILVICLFGLAYVSISRNETRSATDDRLATNAFYVAEAGANRAIKELWGNKGWDGVTDAEYAGGTYTVVVDSPVGVDVTFVSYGTYAGNSGAVEVTLRFDIIPAFVHSYFANTNLHIDNHGVPGMRIYADAWSNGNLDLDAGTRLIGSATCLGYMLIGDKYFQCNDSSVVYGDLKCASLKIESWGFVFGRGSIPEWNLGPANGDVTLMDTYERHYESGEWTGTYDLVNSVGSMWIDGYVEGEVKTLPGGTPPGDSTIVALEMPYPIWEMLEQIADDPSDGLHFASDAELKTYMSSNFRIEWDSVASESVRVYELNKRVIQVDGPVTFTSRPDRIEMNACLVCEGLLVQMRYYHQQPDSLPLIVSDGMVEFDDQGISSPIPADMYGLVYSTGECHFHRRLEADRVYLRGAEIADVVHNCLYYTTEYWLEVQGCSWIFGSEDAEPRIISWRQRKQKKPS
ncbi:hypothetical protein E3J62_03755 [candidate division TA06 bacterium]|uniref:Type 4 fimbrial biogenesis protein PilX N-terminal domain-containing protein n=1 Tax=candidate division TA06 bacterium TaxID=2250710 RepID=A0A523UW08_UNCT6|nr:MAG: hypothetical protein E3J62_03755 [candidate division TA06 bacterium]